MIGNKIKKIKQKKLLIAILNDDITVSKKTLRNLRNICDILKFDITKIS